MGYMRHHVIIVTTYGEHAQKAYDAALDVFGATRLSPLCASELNGYLSFFVVPDGSKEGWKDSDDGDVRRARFKDWFRDQCYEDGSSPYDWCECMYGDDEGELSISGSGR